MEEQLTYFAGEKMGAAVALALGITTLAAGSLLFLSRGPFRGMGVPLALLALVEIGVGVGVWSRLDERMATAQAAYRASPAEMVQRESTRIRGVLRTFELLKLIEVLLIAAGIALTYLFRRNEFVYAAGVGLVLQGSVMLIFDLVSDRRNQRYLDALSGVTQL